MADIGAELLEAVRKRFTRSLSSDRMAAELLERIKSGKTTFADAENYAYRVGKLLAEALGSEITPDVLPDGVVTKEIAEAILGPMLRQDHELVTEAAAETMEALNKAAKIRMKAVRPAVETDRIDGLIEKAASYETYDRSAWVFQEPVINFSQHICDRVIEENVSAHFKAGLSPKITRKAVGKCCKWCASLAGKYDYPAPREIYRRHENCRCLVLYEPGDGKVQNAHTKKVYEDARAAERANRIERVEKNGREAKEDFIDEGFHPEDIKKAATQASNNFVIRDINHPDSFFGEAVELVPAKKGYYDVKAHGSSEKVKIFRSGVDANQLARLLLMREDYNFEPIRLLSCETGKIEDGTCIAKELSRILKVDVLAPTEVLKVSSTGRIKIESEDKKKGWMRLFHPNGSSEDYETYF